MNFTASQQHTTINKHSQLSLAIQNAIRMRHNCAYACGTNRASALFTNCQLIEAQGISLLHKSANTGLHKMQMYETHVTYNITDISFTTNFITRHSPTSLHHWQ